MFKQLSSFDYRLWAVICLSLFLPAIYTTTRIYYLGVLPDTWAFSIAAQVAWLNVGYEVIYEALLFPLMFLLGQVINHRQQFKQRVYLSFGIIALLYS